MQKNASGLVTLTPVKIKDGEMPADVLQTIKAIEMPGFDHYGNPYTAPVLTRQGDDQATTTTRILGANQQKALTLLRSLTVDAEQEACPANPSAWLYPSGGMYANK